jgi:hypothetical protein
MACQARCSSVDWRTTTSPVDDARDEVRGRSELQREVVARRRDVEPDRSAARRGTGEAIGRSRQVVEREAAVGADFDPRERRRVLDIGIGVRPVEAELERRRVRSRDLAGEHRHGLARLEIERLVRRLGAARQRQREFGGAVALGEDDDLQSPRRARLRQLAEEALTPDRQPTGRRVPLPVPFPAEPFLVGKVEFVEPRPCRVIGERTCAKDRRLRLRVADVDQHRLLAAQHDLELGVAFDEIVPIREACISRRAHVTPARHLVHAIDLEESVAGGGRRASVPGRRPME